MNGLFWFLILTIVHFKPNTNTVWNATNRNMKPNERKHSTYQIPNDRSDTLCTFTLQSTSRWIEFIFYFNIRKIGNFLYIFKSSLFDISISKSHFKWRCINFSSLVLVWVNWFLPEIPLPVYSFLTILIRLSLSRVFFWEISNMHDAYTMHINVKYENSYTFSFASENWFE